MKGEDRRTETVRSDLGGDGPLSVEVPREPLGDVDSHPQKGQGKHAVSVSLGDGFLLCC
jgi:hypothetical protein